jgi:flagella basal body P-ring formation protein FlgA
VQRTPRTAKRSCRLLLAVAATLWMLPAPAGAEPATPETLAAAALGAVRAACAGPGELELEAGTVPPLGALQGVDVELRPRLLGMPRTDGAVPVAVEMWQDGQRRGEHTVVVRTRRYQPLLVATVALTRGAVPQPEQVQLAPRAACAAGDVAVESTAQLRGMQLKRAVAVGEPLLMRDLEPCPVVRRGERVAATLEMGSIHVTVSGTAMTDGALGARIAVRNEQGGKRLWGLVTGPGAVRIEPESISQGG